MPRTSFIETKDGTSLFYKDWGAGKPVVFLSNWGLNSDMWQYQMTPMVSQGVRCIAYDRRGIGRSSQPWQGYDYDTLADDLASVIEQLDLHNVMLVSHSMGGGEVVRYLSRHGSGRIARVVLIAPTTPFLLKTANNPDGLDKSAFEQMRAAWCKDFPKWVAENTVPYFAQGTSPEMMQWVANLALQCPLKTAIDLSQAWSETDFRAELPRITVPTLIIQGDKDTLPIDLTGRKTAPLIRGCQFKVYEGEAHGLMFTNMDRLNGDLLAFIKG
ncbi:MAG: alpha/beta hydrolase [Deltaproteobacteria bacterium]|nr:alpha/beta hydrolase [Deltaproteobacteria bacterium]